jgi:hypothetical protein
MSPIEQRTCKTPSNVTPRSRHGHRYLTQFCLITAFCSKKPRGLLIEPNNKRLWEQITWRMRARTFVCCSLSLLPTAVGVRRNKTYPVVCPFSFFLFLVSSDAHPTRKEGRARQHGKKTAAQFPLWGQLAAKVSSGKDNRDRREC